jgi:putative ATP-dependent endonuclease of OLD family
VFILLKLLAFYKEFVAAPVSPGLHLVFIEEPEVHLHPQMQEVFISKLASIATLFTSKFNKDRTWPVQFIVTTHSSHVANRADFECTRYFMTSPDESVVAIRHTVIKDLRQGLSETSKDDREFLHKYMTLTRCDLLFADKAVLIEGATERVLLPKMIARVEQANPDEPKLSSQYVSVVEVGGAYAHLFFDLLAFLELKTLIITDLDTVKPADNNRLIACRVSEGTRTSNACLKTWFDNSDITPTELLARKAEERTKDNRHLAYELPHVDGDPCGRSFEDAFMLANPKLFMLQGLHGSDREAKAWEASSAIETKTDFALKYAIEETGWVVPRYIAEGLLWLAQGTRHASERPVADTTVVPARAGDSEAAEASGA